MRGLNVLSMSVLFNAWITPSTGNEGSKVFIAAYIIPVCFANEIQRARSHVSKHRVPNLQL